jgi:bifunctional DNase/RNase
MQKIALEITGMSYSQSQSGAYALILGEKGGQRKLPIIIGTFEAQSIALGLEKMKPARPMTHDLFKNFADNFQINIKEVIINKFENGVFHALLVCESINGITEIDARSSDAVALAIRFQCPVFTYESILNEAGIVLDDEKDWKKCCKLRFKMKSMKRLQSYAMRSEEENVCRLKNFYSSHLAIYYYD